MKPLNLDNNSCSPISSNCVIWQGPNIPCIKLCTGDTITDVVHALATQLCNVVDAADISTLDLSCLKISTGRPSNLNELLQIIVNKLCTTSSTQASNLTPTRGGSCPNECVVNVAECLRTGGQSTMKLLDYVQLIGNTICDILSDITTINNSITNLDNRVTILEGIEPPAPYVLPSIVPDCTLADSLVEQVLSYVDCTDGSLSDCTKTLQDLYPSFIINPQNLSESFIDMWLVIKDIRDAYKRYNVVAGNSNVTVTSTTVPDSCGPEITYSVKAKSASVVAGTNVASVTTNVVGDNTEYTINVVDPLEGKSGRGIAVFTQTTAPTASDFNTQYANKEGFTVNFIPGNNQIKPGDIWMEPCTP